MKPQHQDETTLDRPTIPACCQSVGHNSGRGAVLGDMMRHTN